MRFRLLSKIEALGVGPDLSPGLARRIALTNRIGFFAVVINVMSAALIFAVGRAQDAWIVLPNFVAIGILITLNARGFHRLSRLGFLVVTNIAVVLFSILFGERSSMHLYFLNNVFLALGLFESKDRKAIGIGIAVPAVLYTALKVAIYGNVRPLISVPPEHISLLKTLVEVTVFFVVTTGIYDLAATFNQNEEKLENAIADLQNIYENAGVGIARVAADGRFLQVNPRLAEILGYSRAELESLRFQDLTHPDDLNVSDQLARNLSQGQLRMARFEKRYLSKDGRTIWVNVSTTSLHDRSGKFTNFVSVIEDVTLQRKNEELIHEQKKVLERVARNRPLRETLMAVARLIEGMETGVSCAIHLVRDGMLVEGVSPSLPSSFLAGPDGLPVAPGSGSCGAAAYFGRKIVSIDVASDPELWGRLHAEALALGIHSSWSTPVFNIEGKVVATINLVWKQRCEPTARHLESVETAARLVGLAVERSQAENVILEQQVKLVTASKMAALGEMAGGLAHEINNPLAVIHGRASILESMALNDKLSAKIAAETAVRIKATAMRISTIVKGLRAFARDGEQDPFKSVTLASVVGETLELSRERFRNHGIELFVEPIPDTIQIECRPVQLSQVLLNLLNNSHDAVREIEEPAERWVRIEHEVRGDDVIIAVVDSGRGIPEEVRGRLMQPFFTTKEIGMGTGLGLSISRGIVTSHNGSLTLDDASPNTRFVIRLPLRQRTREAKPESV